MSRRTTMASKVKKYLLSLLGSFLVMFMQFLLQSKFGTQPVSVPTAVPAERVPAAPPKPMAATLDRPVSVVGRGAVYTYPITREEVRGFDLHRAGPGSGQR